MSYNEAMALVRELRARGCDPYKVLIGDALVVRCQLGKCGECGIERH